MRSSLFLGLALALVGCGQEKTKEPAIVDEALASYLVKFELDIGASTKDIDVVFGALDGDVVGVCYAWTDGKRKIVIDKEYWDSEGEEQKEELIFHELGHCAMNLDHDEGVSFVSTLYCPTSIMYPYTFEYCYNLYRDYYISELRNKTGPKISGTGLGATSECTRAHLHK